MPLQLDVVTAERVVYSDEVDMVVAPGAAGVLGILPRHTPLMSVLDIGELRVKKGGSEEVFALGGGFLEVLNNRVTVLADSAERADEIDIARAEEAVQHAERALQEEPRPGAPPSEAMDRALRRAQVRLKVAREHGRARE